MIANEEIARVQVTENRVIGGQQQLSAADPRVAYLAALRSAEFIGFIFSQQSEMLGFLQSMHDRLLNLTIYMIAYDRDEKHEARARTGADSLVARYPKDPDYLDAKAFVLLSFVKDAHELVEATRLLQESQQLSTESGGQDLANDHLMLADNLRRVLTSR